MSQTEFSEETNLTERKPHLFKAGGGERQEVLQPGKGGSLQGPCRPVLHYFIVSQKAGTVEEESKVGALRRLDSW